MNDLPHIEKIRQDDLTLVKRSQWHGLGFSYLCGSV